MAYHRHHDLDVRIVRIFNTYGPRMRPDDGRVGVELRRAGAARQADHDLRRRHARPGASATSTTRSAGFLALLDCDDRPRRSTSATRTSTRSASWPSWCSRSPGQRSELVHEPLPVDDPSQRRPDITKARTELGWEPRRRPARRAGARRSPGSAVSSTCERGEPSTTEHHQPLLLRPRPEHVVLLADRLDRAARRQRVAVARDRRSCRRAARRGAAGCRTSARGRCRAGRCGRSRRGTACRRRRSRPSTRKHWLPGVWPGVCTQRDLDVADRRPRRRRRGRPARSRRRRWCAATHGTSARCTWTGQATRSSRSATPSIV